jgi:hypothetical protein
MATKYVPDRYLVIPFWIIRLLHIKPHVTAEQALDAAMRRKGTVAIVKIVHVVYNSY